MRQTCPALSLTPSARKGIGNADRSEAADLRIDVHE